MTNEDNQINPDELIQKLNKTDTVIKTNDLRFFPKQNKHHINYKNYKITIEQITKDKLLQYQKTAQIYQTWENGKALPDVNGWKNQNGEPHWTHQPKTPHKNLTFKINNQVNRTGKEASLQKPRYFHPQETNKYYDAKESAILNLILTLQRYKPKEVANTHLHAKTIIDQLKQIKGIGIKTAEKLYYQGVRDYKDIKQHTNHLTHNKEKTIQRIEQKINNNQKILENTPYIKHYTQQYIANKI